MVNNPGFISGLYSTMFFLNGDRNRIGECPITTIDTVSYPYNSEPWRGIAPG